MALTKATYGMISADTSTIDLNIDANTLYVDSSANKVGIGTNSPDYKLDVEGSGNGLVVGRVKNTTAGTAARADMLVESDASDIRMIAASSQYSAVSGWADTGIINTSSSTSGGMLFNVQGNYPYRFMQNATTERMRIHTDGNVGIGTTSPAKNLHISNATNPTIRITDTTNSVNLELLSGNSEAYLGTQSNHPVLFTTNNTEKMRIDASGNLLVGKTSNTLSAAGAKLGTGGSNFTRDNSEVVYVNRTTSDGSLITLAKDGTTVGSIGTNSGYLVIGSPVGTDAHLLIGNGLIHPATSTGSGKDAAIDIGASSNRFKNLYLSGAVNDLTLAAGSISTNASNNFAINTPNSLRINIDSDNNNAGEIFAIGHNQTGVDASNNVLFLIQASNGNVGIGTTNIDEKLQVEEGNIKIEGGSNNTARELIFAHTGYTGNQTILEQRMPGGPYGRLHTTERRLVIEAGSGGSTGAGEKLEFWTNANRAMTIDTSQEVGIGTNSPGVKLDVYNASGWGQARLDGTSGGELLFAKNQTSYGNIYASDTHGLVMQSISGTNVITLRTNSAERMRIDSSGKVGIGTDSPVSLLSVQGDGLQIRLDGTANTSRGIILRNTGTAEGQIQTDGNMHFIQEDAGKYMRFSTANTERMRIDASGNVGVGMTPRTGFSNQDTLQVLGPIGSGRSAGSYAPADARIFRDWFVYAGPVNNINRYVHMKTDLWAGGSPAGNTEYTMSIFRYHSAYSYGSAKVSEGMIAWHNWSGATTHQRAIHNPVSNWAIVKESYTSSDGYVVLVADILTTGTYCCFSIDWHQWGGYTLRNRKVTAVTQNASATGAY